MSANFTIAFVAACFFAFFISIVVFGENPSITCVKAGGEWVDGWNAYCHKKAN